MEYTITVKFTRNLVEDLDVLGEPATDLATELKQQFRKELQACYDNPDVAPAGSFTIESIEGV